MAAPRCAFAAALILVLLLASACAGSGSAPAADHGTGPGGPAAGDNTVLGRGLPELAELPAPTRELSMLGPGWLPLERGAVLDSSGMTPGSGELLDLAASGGLAYAVYGAYGFDGDNGPTGARVQASAASGKFYLAYSDYVNGSWNIGGPYALPAAGGSVEAEIPNSGDYVSPNSFISKYYGRSYVALLVEDGGSLEGVQLDLGVHGGALGPRPCMMLGASGGDSGCRVSWLISPDHTDPDFAGYMIERAPWLNGQYEPLFGGLVQGDSAADTSAELGEVYRYRICAQDSSGRRSIWTTGIGGRISGILLKPVPVVEGLPSQPLPGPLELTIDMGGSFDPEGEAITDYRIEDAGGNVLASGAGFTFNLTLQPGCHLLGFYVTAGGRTGRELRLLKVLPQWKSGAYQAGNPQLQNIFPRLRLMRLVREPVEGYFYLCGYDPFIPAYTVRRYKQGEAPQIFTYPLLEPIQFDGEPMQVGASLYIPLAFDGSHDLLCFDGEGFRMMQNLSFLVGPIQGRVAVCSAGSGHFYYVSARDDTGFYLQLMGETGSGLNEEILGPVPTITALDCCYDETNACIWVGYSTGTDTNWLQLNPADGSLMDNGSFGAFSSPAIDLEYDASSSTPMAAYVSSGHLYYSFYDGSWQPGDQVDLAGGMGTEFDLESRNGIPAIAAAIIGGQASVFSSSTPGTWDQRDVTYSTQSGRQLAMVIYDDGGGTAYCIADEGVNRHTYLARLKSDNSVAMFEDIWPSTGQGMQMWGAGGADGLHLVYLSLLGKAQHLISADGGSLWQGAAISDYPDQLDLCALRDGTIYMATSLGNSAILARWQAPAWVNEGSVASAAEYRPFLAHGQPKDSVSFTAFDDGNTDLYVVLGNQADGFVTGSANFTGGRCFSGSGLLDAPTALPEYSTSYALICVPPVFDYEDSDVNRLSEAGGDLIQLSSVFRGHPQFYDQAVFGRNLAMAESFNLQGYGLQQSVFVSNHQTDPPARIDLTASSSADVSELAYTPDDSRVDYRRTVSTMTLPGLTGVAYTCDLSGRDQHLYWSNFGEWEELPLPGPDGNYGSDHTMNQGQIFVGLDGRWHLVYRNYATDAIMVRSTL
jgi:hypothetical protein